MSHVHLIDKASGGVIGCSTAKSWNDYNGTPIGQGECPHEPDADMGPIVDVPMPTYDPALHSRIVFDFTTRALPEDGDK